MPAFYSPTGNREVWSEKPEGYLTSEEWLEKHPPKKPVFTLAMAVASKIAGINATTSRLILAGFDYMIDGQEYHFGYDETDQANFTKAALAANLAITQSDGSFRQSWRGWVGDTPHTLSLTAPDFLALAMYAGKDHQERILADGWAIQEEVRALTNPEEVLKYVDSRTA